MRHFSTLLILITFFIGCQDDKSSHKALTKPSLNSTTIIKGTDQELLFPQNHNKDTTLFIDNQQFILSLSAELDSTQKYSYTSYYVDEDSLPSKELFQGFDARYKFSLKDKDNKIVFTTTLNKGNFKAITDNSILAESDAILPRFIGFLPKFNAFIFTVEFWVPDSDVGEQSFFMMNRKGEIIEKSFNNYYGGGDSDGAIEISSKQDFILTCNKVIHSNGKVIRFDNKRIWQIGSKLINDNCILDIKEYNDSIKKANAVLMTPFGEILKKFVYRGYYNELGNVVPKYYDNKTNNYYLLDEELASLWVINKQNPTSIYSVSFDEMEEAEGTMKKDEIKFMIDTESSKNTFYANIKTQKIRHSKTKKQLQE